MDTNVKSLAAVTLLMLGLFTGMSAIVTDENGNWFMWTVLFLVGAFLFFMWVMREQRAADEAAEASLDAAEENIRKLEAQAAQMRATGKPEETANGDEVFAEGASATTAEESDNDEEAPLPERADESRPPTSQVIEEAKEGEPVSEAEIADATASPPSETSVEVTPEDALEQPDTAPAGATPGVNPEPVPESLADEPDDLERIEGIGPKYAEILIAAGVSTFDQLAKMDEDSIVALVKEHGGRKSASMATWAEQAKLAAANDWDGLNELQEKLSGGRR